MLRVIHLSHSDAYGGAARFASRTHEALSSIGVDSKLFVSSINTEKRNVFLIDSNGIKIIKLIRAKIFQSLERLIKKMETTRNYEFKSAGYLGTIKARKLNNSDADVIHLHWINAGLISIRQIGKINKPKIWSMLDMWPIMGAEHYGVLGQDERWVSGYSNRNRDTLDKGLDISLISWKLKNKHWKNFTIVAPGSWLAKRISESALFFETIPEIIPPALNVDLFKPRDKENCRVKLNLPINKTLIGFAGINSDRKGWPFIKELLESESAHLHDFDFVFFGKEIKSNWINSGIMIHQLGKIEHDSQLVDIYSSLDVLLMPSTLEAYGLVAQEAQSCGVPVICLSNTGVADVVQNGLTGIHVETPDTDAILKAINELIYRGDCMAKMSANSSLYAKNNWSYDIVANKYMELYSKLTD